MVDEIGTVVESGDGELTVEFTRSAACRNCPAGGLCLPMGKEQARLRLVARPGVEVGCKVRVRLPGKTVVWGSFVIFIWPILTLIVTASIGYWAAAGLGAESTGELWAVLSGLTGLAVSFLIIRRYDRRLERTNRFVPEIVEIID